MMRPVRLEMSAFGSYGGLEVIDFSKKKSGLFLIAGDTGSGKSTIFDAIMFALFDTMSGKERKGTMMRSEYAEDDRETYVKFTFEYGSGTNCEEYTVKRYPAYDRKSKKKNKDGEYSMIRQGSKVSLIMPDGTEYPGKIAQINEKLQEIVGLTPEQFSRIAMIAQGEFQDLIMDKTGNRKEIFRQIFSTQIYEDIEKKIFEKYKNVQSIIIKNSTQLGEIVKGVDIHEESLFFDEFEEAFQRKDSEPDNLLDVLNKEIARVNGIYKEKNGIYKEKENNYNKIEKEIALAKNQNRMMDELKEQSSYLKNLDEKRSEIEEIKKIVNNSSKAKEVSYAEKEYNSRVKEKDNLIIRKDALEKEEEENSAILDKTEKSYEKLRSEYNKKMPEYAKKKDELEKELDNHRQYEKSYELYIKKKKEYETISFDFTKLKEEEKNLSDRKKEIENKLEEYEGAEVRYEQILQKIKENDEYSKSLSEIKSQNKVCKKLKVKLEKLQQELVESLKEWEEQRHRYEECNRQYIAGQSSFLAQTLKENEPCPVCGSLNHPNPAVRLDVVITKEILEQEKDIEDKKEAAKNLCQQKSDKVFNELSADKAVLNQQMKRLFGDKNIDEKDDIEIDELIKNKEKEIEENGSKLESDCREALNIINDKKRKRQELIDNSDKKDKIETEIEKFNDKKHLILAELEGSEKELKILKSNLKHDSVDDVNEEIKSCMEESLSLEKNYTDTEKELQIRRKKFTETKSVLNEVIESIKKNDNDTEKLWDEFTSKIKLNGFEDVDDYHKALLSMEKEKEYADKISSYENEYLQTNTRVQTLKKQTEGRQYVDIEKLQNENDIISEEMILCEKELEKLSFTIQTNKKCRERINELMKSRGDMNNKMRVIKSLNDVANGKIHFQTYIQRQYFKQIIQAANKRLKVMTSGEFLLKCRDIGKGGLGETGLELDVVNPVTGKVRDARTLSGGETFMASLSMALGMADIVQNTVGKTKLDTMFIDEGFGSLSDDVRDKAVRVLVGLAGDERLVGVISHVSELKEQIPQRLMVTKGSHGSHVKWSED